MDASDPYAIELEEQIDDEPCDDIELDGPENGRTKKVILSSRRLAASGTCTSTKRDGLPAIVET
jgi:hypothetical protein